MSVTGKLSDQDTELELEPAGSWRVFTRSFATLAAGEAVARVLGTVAVVLRARRLEPAGFGLVTLGTTLVLWFGMLVDSGTEVLSIREVARSPGRFRAIVEPVLGLRLVASAASVVVFVCATFLIS